MANNTVNVTNNNSSENNSSKDEFNHNNKFIVNLFEENDANHSPDIVNFSSSNNYFDNNFELPYKELIPNEPENLFEKETEVSDLPIKKEEDSITLETLENKQVIEILNVSDPLLIEKNNKQLEISESSKNLENRKEIIVFQDVVKEYRNGEVYTRALSGVNLTIYEGEIVIFLGTSGAGKSTALNLLGGLDKATSGRIIVDGDDITKYDENRMLEYRRQKIGYIFQFYNLIQTLTAKDNVELVLELCDDKNINSEELLERVGLKERINNYPSQLSGGEQQRVSIARALAKQPRILFADEPTGALDYNTTKQVLKLLVDTCKKANITLIIVTHNNFITPIADVVYSFRSGQIISTERNANPVKVEDLPW